MSTFNKTNYFKDEFNEQSLRLIYLNYGKNICQLKLRPDHLLKNRIDKCDKLGNIAFAKGRDHLPIAHAIHLLSTQELRFGLTKLKLRRKKKKKINRGIFLGGGQIKKI